LTPLVSKKIGYGSAAEDQEGRGDFTIFQTRPIAYGWASVQLIRLQMLRQHDQYGRRAVAWVFLASVFLVVRSGDGE